MPKLITYIDYLQKKNATDLAFYPSKWLSLIAITAIIMARIMPRKEGDR